MTERGDCWQRRYKAAAAPPALAEKRTGKGRDCAVAGSLLCAVAERLNSRERGRIGIVTGQSSPSTPPGKGKRKRREPCGEKGLPHAVVARWAEVIGGDAARRLPHCLSPAGERSRKTGGMREESRFIQWLSSEKTGRGRIGAVARQQPLHPPCREKGGMEGLCGGEGLALQSGRAVGQSGQGVIGGDAAGRPPRRPPAEGR